MTAFRRSWVEISRSRIQANYRAAADLAGPDTEICVVVKADAYGHGAVAVSHLVTAAGAGWLAVSSAEEGVALRRAGISRPRILVMADAVALSGEQMVEHGLTPVIHDPAEIGVWAKLAAPTGGRLPYHLKIDSGMGRLGTRVEAPIIRAAVASAGSAVLCEGLMTHFASAADYAGSQTTEQIAAFEAIRAAIPFEPRYTHLEATTAFAYGRAAAGGSKHTMVRCGHAIYGYVSPVRVSAKETAPVNRLAVRPALEWKASLLAVKDVEQGARIGYGAMFTTERPMRIGIVAAGYADGVPHRLGNRGQVIAGGEIAPILGAVSMDVTTIDLSRAAHLRAGDAVTIIGQDGQCAQDAQLVARVAGTISYSVLCGIGPRVERVWVD